MPQTEMNQAALSSAEYEVMLAPPEAFLKPAQNFERQIETLKKMDVACNVDADMFFRRLHELGENRFLFVPPPPEKLHLRELMAKVVLDGRQGKSCINHLEIVGDLDGFPTAACILTDVDDGRSTMEMSISAARKQFARSGRHHFSLWMGIVFAAIFPSVLHRRELYCAGSYVGAKYYFPLLKKDVNPPDMAYRPYLVSAIGIGGDNTGVPSAGAILLP